MNPLCSTYWGLLFFASCAVQDVEKSDAPIETSLTPELPEPIQFRNNSPISVKSSKFQVEFQWRYVNYTWPRRGLYKRAMKKKQYIPNNIVITGMKYYKGNVYVSMPKIRRGVPVTLGLFPVTSKRTNPLIIPYPNWDMYQNKECTKFVSVQGMEIDRNGIMWILDGHRVNNSTRCPPKLVLLDLNNHGNIIQNFEFSEDLSKTAGGYLNDLVVDDSDGEFAYITESSASDPGLIVYSKERNVAWKFRDPSFFADISASGFTVNNFAFNTLLPLNGIALSPQMKNKERMVYYSSVTSFNLYSINTKILKDETMVLNDSWRKEVKLIGKKQAQSDGLIIDNTGNMYYGLLPKGEVAKWNTKRPFSESKVIFENPETMTWIDTWAFDDKGYLRVINNNLHKFFNISHKFNKNETNLRIVKVQTGTKSYMHLK